MSASQVLPIPNGPKPQKRPKQERNGLRKVSKKQAEKLRWYKIFKAAYLRVRPRCEFDGCRQSAVDIHHKAGRGKNLNVVSTWSGLCRFHHDWVHSHPKEARKMGLLV